MRAGFRENDSAHDVPPQMQTRHSFMAVDADRFVGAASGLTDRNWFYLTDLWLEMEYRCHGIGTTLLQCLEDAVRQQGIRNFYTWTAGYEAPSFYRKLGYTTLGELKDFFPTGHSRLAMHKSVE